VVFSNSEKAIKKRDPVRSKRVTVSVVPTVQSTLTFGGQKIEKSASNPDMEDKKDMPEKMSQDRRRSSVSLI
jgi:hypothetical protein